MGIQKSQENAAFVASYLQNLIVDLYDLLSRFRRAPFAHEYMDKNKVHDSWYVARRIKAEGVSFATKRLPELGKYLDARLAGYDPEVPRGFAPYVTHGDNRAGAARNARPLFLHVFWNFLDGVEGKDFASFSLALPEDERNDLARIVTVLRSVLYSVYKLDIPYSEEARANKVREFLDTEKEVAEFELPGDDFLGILGTARYELEQIMAGFRPYEDVREAAQAASSDGGFELPFAMDVPIGDKQVRPILDLNPRHGPGAVSTGERDETKWRFSHRYESLHQRYPYYEFMYGIRSNGNCLQLLDCKDIYMSMERLPYPVAKLVLVPKDSRGPRLISAEPLELQFMQQAMAVPLVKHIETRSTARGHVNFTDQTVNQKLALSSSLDDSWSTLDLKDASDRVSLKLFRAVWPKAMQPYFEALRSHATRLPDGSEVTLEKFAPMGSALCFPVESLIFYVLSVAAVACEGGLRIRDARKAVYVYGDDIIVRREYARAVMNALERYGLKVNRSKSFVTGWFKESCGCDAWLGHVVTPLRLKKPPVRRSSQGTNAAAYCAYISTLLSLRCFNAASMLEKELESFYGCIPHTKELTGYLSIVDVSNPWYPVDYRAVRWNVGLQRLEARLLCLRNKTRPTQLDGWGRLMRALLTPVSDCDPDEVVVRDATQISRRWVPIPVF